MVVAVKGWIFAFLAVGPAALVFGSVAGVLLQSLARKYHPLKVAILPAAMLGLVLGSAVPAANALVAWFWLRKVAQYNFTRDMLSQLPVAALTGVICAFLLLWLFRATSGGDGLRP